MSSEDGIQISNDLIKSIVESIAAHDKRANQDQTVAVQYLVALAGYLAGSYPGPDSEREEFLEHLVALMRHVADDCVRAARQRQGPRVAPRGREIPSDDPAMGTWRPG